MQTVMNDLTALKTGAGEQSRVVAALEARVRALAAEHARLKAELRRGDGFRLEHRGDATYVSGGRGASLSRGGPRRSRSRQRPGTFWRRRRGRDGRALSV